LSLALKEFRRLLLDGIDEAELDKCKRIVFLALAESLSYPRALIRRIGLCHRLERKLDIEAERIAHGAVALSDICAATAEIARYPLIAVTAESSVRSVVTG
jgi:hypothetical protein